MSEIVKDNLRDILEQVRSGEVSVVEAEQRLGAWPFEELDFAKLDHHRRWRTGCGEVVFCQGKDSSHIAAIMKHLAAEQTRVLGTRATLEQYEYIKNELPEVVYEPLSRTLKLNCEGEFALSGKVMVCSGGTADLPVAEEAALVAEFLGANVERCYDIGVAGLQRLLSKVGQIRQANCVIAVAGMDGALPGVLAGLLDKPVIAVPTSVGYGAAFQGVAPMLTMLNACAAGVAVVNIDNGFGAGYLAAQINRLIMGAGAVSKEME